jgi:formylglycine-generating enzyme required for sulfatase activity
MPTSPTPEQALSKLRDLLAAGDIDKAMFTTLSAPLVSSAAGARRGPVDQEVAEGGVAIAGDSHAPVHIGSVTHIHAAPGTAADETAAQTLRTTYLQRVVRQAGAVSLLASGDQRGQVQLAAVYTALLTKRLADVRPKRDAAGLDKAMQGRDAPRLSAVAVLNSDRRLVLLGGPGSGKSTFVNFVAQTMAGELLGAQAEPLTPTLSALTAPLPSSEEPATRAKPGKDDEPSAQPWQHGALLPVVVVLRELAAQIKPNETAGADTVWRYLQTALHTACLADFAVAMKQELMAVGGLVMFDGLDEVPDAAAKRTQIQAAVEDFQATFHKCRVLVTCRTYAYQRQDWKLPGFAEAELDVFSLSQISSFVRAWYGQMVALLRLTAEDAQGRGSVLLRQVQLLPNVRELAARPLLLTLFVRLQSAQDGNLPEKREELYFESVKLLLNEWEALKVRLSADGSKQDIEPSLSQWLQASPHSIRKQLDQLAFEAHRDQKDKEGTADIREADLVAALLQANPSDKPVDIRQLQRYLRDRAGILAEHGGQVWQFPHRSFQEYLAACHLANKDFPRLLAKLVREDPPRWREVALLGGAHAARGNSSMPTWGLTEALCPAPPPARNEPADGDAWGALIAGQVLVASGDHAAPAAEHQHKLTRVRDWQLVVMASNRMPAIERTLAGRTLAALGDPRPEVMTLDGMQFCLVPPGPFVMGDDDLTGDEKPQHTVDIQQPYFMARVPVTVAQWREALAASKRAPKDRRSTSGRSNDPVTFVDWAEAAHFCDVLTQRWQTLLPTGWVVALPSEAEWEKAARGGQALPTPHHFSTVATCQATLTSFSPNRMQPNPMPDRAYPMGSGLDGHELLLLTLNVAGKVGQTSAMGCFAHAASPYGCEDMAGNVWEWTRSHWKPYPYQPDDPSREDMKAGGEVRRVVRGGSWFDSVNDARCACRIGGDPDARDDDLGFRVVLRSAPVPKR